MHTLAAIVIVTNIGFVAAFDTDKRVPAWVSYDIEPAEVVASRRLHLPFVEDPRVPESDNSADYSRSGYDRGHLAPAADFNWSTNALRETYRFTNIAPQSPSVNRGRWADIEREVRTLAASGSVHVLTFPEGFDGRRIGRVAVPSNFVKVAWGEFGVRVWRVPNFTTPRGVKGHADPLQPNRRKDSHEDTRQMGHQEIRQHGEDQGGHPRRQQEARGDGSGRTGCGDHDLL